ncbi:MAG: hypothetical protein B6D39_00630 [Anaerolineae bacterium UTCFX2]|jgi:hypothetical protein|nr:pilus assembly protein [Anaerolineae bacterium]MCZ7551413.1 pilus assembly protein [Anaerolineales bacterium]OQY94971.1 MAG: hypothetical protein B6D39_00630 [Anaerolineae bacterium UTCFX2]
MPKNLLRRLRIRKNQSGQSFVELAIMLPLLLLMLVGMVEVAFTMFIYLTALDLTREAARFASVRDFNVLDPYGELNPTGPVASCGTDEGGNPITDPARCACLDDDLHFFLDAACFFTDPKLNPFIPFDRNTDDVVITAFTVAGGHISESHPGAGYWSLNNDNWKKDCYGNVVRSAPIFSWSDIEENFVADAPADKGLVLVEAFYCWNPVAYLPFISDYIPSKIRIHTYTFMPSPEALPTPTPIIASP